MTKKARVLRSHHRSLQWTRITKTMSSSHQIDVGPVRIGSGLFLIAGPCVIEGEEHALKIAIAVSATAKKLGVPYIFKASYDKANRTSLKSFRGPGLKDGLLILRRVKEQAGVPVLTDVHQAEDIAAVAEAVDV